MLSAIHPPSPILLGKLLRLEGEPGSLRLRKMTSRVRANKIPNECTQQWCHSLRDGAKGFGFLSRCRSVHLATVYCFLSPILTYCSCLIWEMETSITAAIYLGPKIKTLKKNFNCRVHTFGGEPTPLFAKIARDITMSTLLAQSDMHLYE